MNAHLIPLKQVYKQTAPSVDENEECFNTSGAKRVLLVYEDNLRELFKFCSKCGSPVNTEEIEETENEGTQYSVKINCLNGCTFIGQSQPCFPGVKFEGNLALYICWFIFQWNSISQISAVCFCNKYLERKICLPCH